MFIRVHVYDDGDTELTKVAHHDTRHDDLHFDEVGGFGDLRAELRDYGHEDERINKTIDEVMAGEENDPVIV